jgi:hypothetical protein
MVARTNYIGTVHIADKDTVSQQASVTPDGSLLITPVGSATATGLSTYYLSAGASTNATSVKASAGRVYKIRAFNDGATAVFLKMYNLAVPPTVGTSTVFDKYEIPAGSAGAGFIDDTGLGQAYSVGIAFAITSGFADNTSGAVGSGVISVTILYL